MKPRHYLNPHDKEKHAKRIRKRKPHVPKSKRKKYEGPFGPEILQDGLGELLLHAAFHAMGFRGRDIFEVLPKLFPAEPSAVSAPTSALKKPLGTETLESPRQPEESSPRPSRPTTQSRSTKKKRKNPLW